MVPEPIGLGALEMLAPEFAGASAPGHVTISRETFHAWTRRIGGLFQP